MAKFKISTTRKLPEGYTAARKAARLPRSERETFPVTQLEVGHSFYVPGRDARSMRGTIHSRSRVGSARFVAETDYSKTGTVKGTYVYRVK